MRAQLSKFKDKSDEKASDDWCCESGYRRRVYFLTSPKESSNLSNSAPSICKTKEENKMFDKIREFASFHEIDICIVGDFVNAKLCDIPSKNSNELKNDDDHDHDDEIDVDLAVYVGLIITRKDEYDDHESPRLKDDVLRRDFSVNTIYYTRNMLALEIIDLKCGMVRACHNNSFNIFIKHPLHISGAIRFGFGTFGFKLDDKVNINIVNSCKMITCIELTNEIPRELRTRLIELLKILNSNNLLNLTSLKFIVNFNMESVLFGIESKLLKSLCTSILIDIQESNVDAYAKEVFARGLTYCQNIHSLLAKQLQTGQDRNDNHNDNEAEDYKTQIREQKCTCCAEDVGEEISRENYFILMLVSFLFPLLTHIIRFDINRINHKQINNSQNSIIGSFIMQSIPGFNSKFAQKIETYFDSCRFILSIINDCNINNIVNGNDIEKTKTKIMRLNCGMLLLRMKNEWKNAFLLTKSVLMANKCQNNDNDACTKLNKIEKWIENESNLLNSKDYNFLACWEWRPIISNRDLIKQYNIVDKKLLSILNKEIKQLQLMYEKQIAQKMVSQMVQKWIQQYSHMNKTATSCA